MQSSFPGLLISFEGGEGSGKSTQIQLLAERLRDQGRTVLTLREPGGTKIGEVIRSLVLDPQYGEMTFATEVLLFQAQRAQLYQEVILPALKKGAVVLMDRTRDSSLIYQGVVRRFGKDLIEQLNTISTQNTYPEITFLLDISVKTGLERKLQSGQVNRLDQEKTEFHQQVRDAYLAVAQENNEGRWQVIDAHQSIAEIAEQVWAIFKQYRKN